MDKKVDRYFKLKMKHKEIEQKLSKLRNEILNFCEQQGVSELEMGSYKVKLIHQERKEYDDRILYEALPDSKMWRLLSKADSAKIAGLIKLNVITEDMIKGTYSLKNVTLLQVDKL